MGWGVCVCASSELRARGRAGHGRSDLHPPSGVDKHGIVPHRLREIPEGHAGCERQGVRGW